MENNFEEFIADVRRIIRDLGKSNMVEKSKLEELLNKYKQKKKEDEHGRK